MRVVSNTSPISNLAIIARLELLQRRYKTLLIPTEVEIELSVLTHLEGKRRIAEAIAAGWISVHSGSQPALNLSLALDLGETAAIALAQREKADILLIDEKLGREVARQLGIKVAGVLGELIYAKRLGSIASVKDEIALLRKEAGFFINPAVEKFVLGEVGE